MFAILEACIFPAPPEALFVALALAGRGIKYLVIGTLTFYLGPTVRNVLDRHFRWVAAILAILLLAALVFWRR